MSFRTVRNLGLGILLLIVVAVSILSYAVMSSSAERLENIITVEEAKMKKWHALFEVTTDAKDSLYDYYLGRSELIAPVSLLIKKALSEIEDVKNLSSDENDLAETDLVVKELKTFRQAVYAYGLEVREGYIGGTSTKEMEDEALQAAHRIVHLTREALDGITLKIENKNMAILKVTEMSRKVLGVALVTSIFFTVMVAFFMGRALARPIHELVEGTRRVAQGDLSQEIRVKSDDEIGELSGSFNRMVRDLREQRSKLVDKNYVDSIFANMSDALIVTTPDKKIRTVNRAACGLLGYGEKELIGKNFNFLFPGEEKVFREGTIFDRLAKDGRVSSYETNYKTKDGKTIPVLFSGSVMKDKSGGITNLICTARDITGIKESEKTLIRQSQELIRAHTELQRIIFVASHDLQEPLRTVSSYVQLLAKKHEENLDTDTRDFIGFIVEGTKRMQMLIKGLLAYSRVSMAGRAFKQIDCEAVLTQVLTDLAPFIQSNRAKVTHDPLPEVMADDVQLTQLLQSLIGNAIKFRGEEPPRVHVSAKNDNETWIFSVRDNGTGIEQKYREKIFQIFQRLHSKPGYSEPSIALAVCKKIVERHGGQIWVESEHGKGSTFYFTIPVKKERRTSLPAGRGGGRKDERRK
ncbi:MAG TPA: PAS domain S-box protein [Nitrospirae bacterium]|nr:phytochrome-like protein cph1 [bacterium BMS3Abin10]GBE39609.1 phytochrome-like protein cph1 [bacterium BMS3Bbin08]HDH50591.1 PAS domain S-box protein [Nitrospirota bacterium]HDK82332.1 PAS domain S-box protein [Nitrospirota bacterium]